MIRRLAKRLWHKASTVVAEMNISVHPNPIFILGNQKSGTSAVAGLLAEATGLGVTLDFAKEIDHPRYPEVLRGELRFHDFVKHHKICFSQPIVKEPSLTLLYKDLRSYFPSSQFVYVLRDPRDNIRSILDRLHLPGDLPDLKQQPLDIPPAWTLILNSEWLGFSEGNYVDMLAARWNLMVDVLLSNRESIRLVRYEEFVKDKRGAINRLAGQLAVRVVKDISPKVDFQFQPVGSHKTQSWKAFFSDDNLHR